MLRRLNESLEQELEAVRNELAEARAVIAAIRNGEADAVVVETADGLKVYTLRGADEPYRTIVENLKEGAVTIGSDGVIFYCNEAFGSLVGQTSSSLSGRRIEDFVGAKVAASLIAGGDSAGVECLITSADGRRLYCKMSSAPHHTEDGNIICVLVTDLTGQDLRLRHNAIIDSTDDAVLSFDLAGRITSWNPAAEVLFGYSAAEAIGRDADLLVERLDEIPSEETTRGAFDRAIAGEKFQRDTRRIAKDGTVIDVSVTTSPIKMPDGRVAGVSAIMRDIRARIASEAKLRESEAFNASVLSASPDCLKVIDLDGRIDFINDNGRRLMEIDNSSFCAGAIWSSMWPEATHQQIADALELSKARK